MLWLRTRLCTAAARARRQRRRRRGRRAARRPPAPPAAGGRGASWRELGRRCGVGSNRRVIQRGGRFRSGGRHQRRRAATGYIERWPRRPGGASSAAWSASSGAATTSQGFQGGEPRPGGQREGLPPASDGDPQPSLAPPPRRPTSAVVVPLTQRPGPGKAGRRARDSRFVTGEERNASFPRALVAACQLSAGVHFSPGGRTAFHFSPSCLLGVVTGKN